MTARRTSAHRPISPAFVSLRGRGDHPAESSTRPRSAPLIPIGTVREKKRVGKPNRHGQRGREEEEESAKNSQSVKKKKQNWDILTVVESEFRLASKLLIRQTFIVMHCSQTLIPFLSSSAIFSSLERKFSVNLPLSALDL